jgi:hypothetical protein
MRRIKLLELGPPPEISYDLVLREVIRRPLDPQKGADIAEVRLSIRVLDALDAANGTLELEEADYQHLKAKLAAMPWAVVDRRIVQLFDDVNAAGDDHSKSG